jgi:hypothetical protein
MCAKFPQLPNMRCPFPSESAATLSSYYRSNIVKVNRNERFVLNCDAIYCRIIFARYIDSTAFTNFFTM